MKEYWAHNFDIHEECHGEDWSRVYKADEVDVEKGKWITANADLIVKTEEQAARLKDLEEENKRLHKMINSKSN